MSKITDDQGKLLKAMLDYRSDKPCPEVVGPVHFKKEEWLRITEELIAIKAIRRTEYGLIWEDEGRTWAREYDKMMEQRERKQRSNQERRYIFINAVVSLMVAVVSSLITVWLMNWLGWNNTSESPAFRTVQTSALSKSANTATQPVTPPSRPLGNTENTHISSDHNR